jgi:transcription initiation factor TFIIB
LVELTEEKRCPECGSEIIYDSETKESVCKNCGLVVKEESISNSPIWDHTSQQFTQQGREDFNIHDKGLPTTIGFDTHDARGGKIDKNTNYKMFRLRRMQKGCKVDGRSDRSLIVGLQLLNLYSDKLNLPYATKTKASIVYRRAFENSLVRGRLIIDVVVASIYFACREDQILRSLKEVVQATSTKKKSVSKTYRLFLTDLPKVQTPLPYTYTKYITKIGEIAHISGEKQGEAIKLLNIISSHSNVLSGKDPKGLGVAALYIICSDEDFLKVYKPEGYLLESVSQKELARVVGMTEVTVRNRYKQLEEEWFKIQKGETK